VKVAFGTRIEPDLQKRLKIYAAAMDRTIEDVVAAALDGYLESGHRAGETPQPENESDPGAGTPGPQTV